MRWLAIILLILINYQAIKREGLALSKSKLQHCLVFTLAFYIALLLPAFQALLLWMLGFLKDLEVQLFRDAGNYYVAPYGWLGNITLVLFAFVLGYTLVQLAPMLKKFKTTEK